MVYIRLVSSPDTAEPLPWFGPLTTAPGDQVLNFNYQIGQISVILHNLTETSEDPGTFGNPNAYRYIIIPGGTAAGRSANYLDLNDYDAVMKYYGIDL
jgi:hypothetical protein